jgi:DNA-binding CsgD family transcriptional regulator/tetratricopeptide (TPR) repeat protein
MVSVATRVSSPVFIGRRGELARLVASLDRAIVGNSATVLVGGDAGIGKSRLIGEFAAHARRSGTLVLAGGCVSLGGGGGLPFAPIVEALRRLPAIVAEGDIAELGSIEDLRSPATTELGRLVPELGSSRTEEVISSDRPEWIQARIFEGLLALLQALAVRAPVVLILEDLHWADDSTRDVASFLARNARSERLLVIGTYRTDELHRRHPLRPWLSEMERVPRVERFELTRFGREEIEAQVGAILDHPASSGLVDTIERRTEGNPFFVEELVASGAQDTGDGVPETLRNVLLIRVAALSEEAQRILGIASVAGRTVDIDLLAAVVGSSEEDLEGPLREALASQIVVTDPVPDGEGYRFRHALLAEAVYDDLLPSARRRLHAAYSAILDARLVPQGAEAVGHLSALAYHATAAHEPARALRAWIGAARAAANAYAFAESMDAYERAIDLWDAVPEDDRPEGVDAAELHSGASVAALIAGRPDRAADLARVAVALIDRTQHLDRWAESNELLARALGLAGSMTESLAIMEATAASLEGSEPTPARARVVAALAREHMLRGDHPQAIAAARSAIQLASLADSPETEGHALNTLGVSTVYSGRSTDGLRLLREAFDRAKSTIVPLDDQGRAYTNLSAALLIAGHAQESLAIAREGIAWARSVGATAGFGHYIAGNGIDAATYLGEWDEAETMLEDWLPFNAVGVNRIGIIGVAGSFYTRRGRIEIAERLLREGRTLIEPLEAAMYTGLIGVGVVELALTTGHPADASLQVSSEVERIQRTRDRYYLADLLTIGARAEADQAELARAHRDVAAADRAAATAAEYAELLRSFASATPGPDAFGGRFESDAAVSAAESARADGRSDPAVWRLALDALGSTGDAWLRAYASFRLAEAMLASHAPRQDAQAALSTAFGLANWLSAQPLIGWIEAIARRARISLLVAEPPTAEPEPSADRGRDLLGLTKREREILELVAIGYTNRRIAETLFISESTAGVHVSNILGKLGVENRTEAAAVAVRLGLDGTEAASVAGD